MKQSKLTTGMKKRIMTISLIVAIAAVAVAGGTLAYFTDTEARANVFTAGNVEIALHESNNDDDPTDGSYDYDKNTAGEDVVKDEDYQNWIDDLNTKSDQLFIAGRTREKDVWVENLGDNTMYTRVHIGVPAAVYTSATAVADQILNLNINADNGSGWTLKKADGTENSYYEEFFGVEYFVMVYTFEGIVDVNEVTPICLSSVSMPLHVDCEHEYTDANGDTYIEYVTENKNGRYKAENGQIPVLVAAEAGQSFTFDNAFTALDTQFGTPASTVDYVSPLSHLFDADGNIIDVYEDA